MKLFVRLTELWGSFLYVNMHLKGLSRLLKAVKREQQIVAEEQNNVSGRQRADLGSELSFTFSAFYIAIYNRYASVHVRATHDAATVH